MIETATAPSADLRSHFGLSEIPFTREISVESRWHSAHFDEPLADLVRTIDQRLSAVLIAPAGTGKTALLRALRARLPEARYKVHYVKVTSLSKRDICSEIAVAAGLAPAGSYPMLVRRLQERFEAVHGDDGLRPVLLIDEAHDMRPEVLATLRLLRRTETRKYMEHRLTIAGCRSFPFDEPSADAVFEISRGNLRAIDQLCRKSLELAALSGRAVVDATTVAAARQRLMP